MNLLVALIYLSFKCEQLMTFFNDGVELFVIIEHTQKSTTVWSDRWLIF